MDEPQPLDPGALSTLGDTRAAPRSPLRYLKSTFTSDTGNAAVEVAVVAPLLIAFLAGLLVAMRVQQGGAVVAQAAADAARQASIARTAAQAHMDATSSAMITLRGRGLHCTPIVRLDLSGFHRPVGQAGTVSARVTCVIRLADIALPGMPGARTVTRSHRSPIDIYRAR